jgi:hypothetical protein
MASLFEEWVLISRVLPDRIFLDQCAQEFVGSLRNHGFIHG